MDEPNQVVDSNYLFKMKLMEVINLGMWTITRVPGGWIYSCTTTDAVPSSSNEAYREYWKTENTVVFVPFTSQVKEERLENLISS